MRAALTIAAVELRRFVRDRGNLFFVFVFPLVLVLLLGSQFGGDGGQGRVALAGPQSPLRAAVVTALEEDEVVVSLAAAEDARERLARGRTDVGIFLSPEAAAAYDAGQDVELAVVTAPQATARVVLEQVRGAVRTITVERGQLAALVAAGVGEEQARAALGEAAAAATAPRIAVTDADAVAQEFAGLGRFDLSAGAQLLLFVFLNTLAGSAALIQARRYGVLSRTLAGPVSAGQAVAGQALGRFTIAAVQGLYIMAGTALLFGVDWGNLALSLLIVAVFAAVAAATAMVIGSVMDNDGAASGLGIGTGMVLGALGGTMVPLEFFPQTLQQVAHLTPHAWAYEAFAEVQRRDGTLVDILPQLGVLAGMAAAGLVAGALLLRRSLARAM